MTTRPDTEQPSRDQQIRAFGNDILFDWNLAMDRFFTAVEHKMRAANLTVDDVTLALDRGYGDDIAHEWSEWITTDPPTFDDVFDVRATP